MNFATRFLICAMAAAMVVLGLVVGFGLVIIVGVRDNSNISLVNQRVLLGCNTPGPGHDCYDETQRGRAANVAAIRHSIDCVFDFDHGLDPPGCADVRERIMASANGADPFAPRP